MMLTRRNVLRRTRKIAVLGTTVPWWLVRQGHAARPKKLTVWNLTTFAPQLDKILKDQCYAYAKQAGIKENEIDYVIPSNLVELLRELNNKLKAGDPPDVTRLGGGFVQLYRTQGHLLDVTGLVEKLQQKAGGIFPISLQAAMYRGKAYGIPQSVSPWALVTRLDILEGAKVDPPKTWDEFIEVCKKLQKPPALTGFGMCLGLHTTDADNNVMNLIWCYGGKHVEADNKTIVLNSPGTIQGVKVIADMYYKHKILPKGAITWDNIGNNKAYQSRQVIFVLNPTSIYSHLATSAKELYEVTGMLPVPAGPAGAVQALSTEEWLLFKHNPYPEVAKGLVQYWMEPENLRVVMEEAGGRWGPPYKQMYETNFWKRPAFQHWRGMLDRGRQFAFPRTIDAASGEVIDLNVMPRMMHRVLVEGWEAEKAVEEAHKKVVEAYAQWPQG